MDDTYSFLSTVLNSHRKYAMVVSGRKWPDFPVYSILPSVRPEAGSLGLGRSRALSVQIVHRASLQV